MVGCRFAKQLVTFSIPLILSLGVLLLVGYVTPRRGELEQADCTLRLYVFSNGLHTNLLLPVDAEGQGWNWRQHLPLSRMGETASNQFRYLSFGWGDREVYLHTPTLADLRLDRGFKALFWPTPAVIYVQGYSELPRYTAMKCLGVSRKNYRRLMQFIAASFASQTQGGPIYLQSGYEADSAFFAATGSYSLLQTCNTWTATGLDIARVQTPLWSALAPAVMHHAESPCRC